MLKTRRVNVTMLRMILCRSGSRGFSKFMEIVVVKPTIFMTYLWGVMEMLGFTTISGNFHDSRNYGSGSPGFCKFIEIVGNVGKTNIFHDLSVGKS